jgi:hypothetical protein
MSVGAIESEPLFVSSEQVPEDRHIGEQIDFMQKRYNSLRSFFLPFGKQIWLNVFTADNRSSQSYAGSTIINLCVYLCSLCFYVVRLNLFVHSSNRNLASILTQPLFEIHQFRIELFG